jgi:DNA-directed RNA polymerase specialized sigma24 family protein
MSKALRPKLAALIGAATLSAASPAAAGEQLRDERSQLAPEGQNLEQLLVDRALDGSLRAIIETRIEAAERERRYGDIDELTTLWLTLARREQLDRVVERGEQFLNVALKNQRRSELRGEARALRRTCEDDPVEVPGDRCAPHELIDAERFIGRLSDPYQTAVKWSLTGMNHREVAEQMGASHAAVRKWAQRLREQLAEADDDLLG